MQALQDTGSSEEYLNFKENFKISKKLAEKSVDIVTTIISSYRIEVFTDAKRFSIDSIEIEPIYMEPFTPGVCG